MISNNTSPVAGNFDTSSGSTNLGTSTYGVGVTGVEDWTSVSFPVPQATAALPEGTISEQVVSNQGSGQAISTTHGFKQGRAPDDTAAIEVKITRPNGEEVTCLLSEGAKGKVYSQLATYGKKDLKGATLLTHDDFKAVVDSLYSAIKGYTAVKDALQTEDQALQQAYIIVTEGVRRAGGFSWAKFDLDSGGAVVGRRVNDHDLYWRDGNTRFCCAAFVSPPAESK
jgi:hypothetical protein